MKSQKLDDITLAIHDAMAELFINNSSSNGFAVGIRTQSYRHEVSNDLCFNHKVFYMNLSTSRVIEEVSYDPANKSICFKGGTSDKVKNYLSETIPGFTALIDKKNTYYF